MHNVISSSSLCAEGEIFLSERMTFFNAFILFSLTAVPGNALGRRIFRGAVDSSFSKRGPSHLSCLFLGGFVMQMWLKLIIPKCFISAPQRFCWCEGEGEGTFIYHPRFPTFLLALGSGVRKTHHRLSTAAPLESRIERTVKGILLVIYLPDFTPSSSPYI